MRPPCHRLIARPSQQWGSELDHLHLYTSFCNSNLVEVTTVCPDCFMAVEAISCQQTISRTWLKIAWGQVVWEVTRGLRRYRPADISFVPQTSPRPSWCVSVLYYLHHPPRATRAPSAMFLLRGAHISLIMMA